MATKLAKKRKVITKEELQKDIFDEDIGVTPGPDKPPDDDVDAHDDIIGSDEDKLSSLKEEVLKEFGKDGVEEFNRKMEGSDNEKKDSVSAEEGCKDSGKGNPILPDRRDVRQEKEVASGVSEYKSDIKSTELIELNRCANFILGCLPPGIKKDFEVAAYDNRIEDMGIYMLGLLNQAYKMGDYYNPDVEKEWEMKTIGYRGDLLCQQCGKVIINPRNINQVFCNNLCARNSKRYATGIIKPVERELPTEDQEDKKSYEKELIG